MPHACGHTLAAHYKCSNMARTCAGFDPVIGCEADGSGHALSTLADSMKSAVTISVVIARLAA